MRRNKIKIYQAIALAVIALLYFGARTLPHQREKAPAAGGFVYVSRVVDGDTLKLSDGRRVRLIGIDTPEVHYSDKLLRDARRNNRDIKAIQDMGRKASDFTKGLAENKKVRLEFDVERKDKYGRLLAYAYLEDGTFVNARIMEEGYAQVMTIPPNVRYADYFLKLQRQARENRKGLWQGYYEE